MKISDYRARAVGVFLCAPLLLLVSAQDPPHSYSWYSGDIAGEVDRAHAANVPIELSKIEYLMDALRVNSERWSYIETQVMENLDIDIDEDQVQEPLQNLALAQLLLADLGLQAGGRQEGFQAMQRGCAVQELVHPDDTTPHPYSHGSLSKRCVALIDMACPTRPAASAMCQDTLDSMLSSQQLRQALVESKSRRMSGLEPLRSAQASPLVLPLLETKASSAGSSTVPKIGAPVDRREYSEIASTLYDSDQLMRLYTPEAPSNNPLAPAVVAPSRASMTALYLCIFISLSITAVLVNKRRQYSRRGGKPHHSLLTAKGLKELVGHVEEVLATSATEAVALIQTIVDRCYVLCVELVKDAKTRPGTVIRGASSGGSQHGRSKLSVKELPANKPPFAKKNSSISAAIHMKSLSTSGDKPTRAVSRGASSVSTVSTNTKTADKRPLQHDDVSISLMSTSHNVQSVECTGAVAPVTEKENTHVVTNYDAPPEKVPVLKESCVPERQCDDNHIECNEPEESEFDDASSLSSLTNGPDMIRPEQDTPSPVIPFIADYEDEMCKEAQAEKARYAQASSTPPRNSNDDVLPWAGDFKLFSPTASNKKTTVATFGHPTIGIISPADDNNSVTSRNSSNSWMGIDGLVYTDRNSNISQASQLQGPGGDQNMDLRLYNYWGGGSAVSVNSGESCLNVTSYQNEFKGFSHDKLVHDAALKDSSHVVSKGRFQFAGQISKLPISPPRKTQLSAPALALDTSFLDYSAVATGGPSTGNSKGYISTFSRDPSSATSEISRAFSDDEDYSATVNSSLHDLYNEVSRPLGVLPIAPTLFGSADASSRSLKPPMHNVKSSLGPPPGFELHRDEDADTALNFYPRAANYIKGNKSFIPQANYSGAASSRADLCNMSALSDSPISQMQGKKCDPSLDTIVLQVIGL